MNHTLIALATLTVVLACALAFVLLHLMSPKPPAEPAAPDEFRVDPWRLQRGMMEMSGQPVASLPEINRTALLYYALILEEAAELGSAILATLIQEWEAKQPSDVADPRTLIKIMLDCETESMHNTSVRMRKAIAEIPDFAIRMTPAGAAMVLDGTTDLAVVNSGMSIAAGLPGAAAYLEVQESNYSKANPETGVIDKTADGKWIKGERYRVPNLDAVLAPLYRAA